MQIMVLGNTVLNKFGMAKDTYLDPMQFSTGLQ